MIDGGRRISGRDHEKPNVEMQVCGLVAALRYRMDVEIDRWLTHFEPVDPHFFVRLSQRRNGEVAVAVDMPTRLEPTIELGMMNEKGRAARWVDNQRRSGEMAIETRSIQSIGVGVAEVENAALEYRLLIRLHE